jgi:glutamine synthetase
MTPEDVLKLIEENNVQIVDLRFADLLGTWQHFSVPARALDPDAFENGFGFDGSSIRGWKAINESDMLVVPDARTAKLDPFLSTPTLSVAGNVHDPITREPYGKDPRAVAQRAEAYLSASGIGDTAYFGPECEFFVFDHISFDQTAFAGYYYIDSKEGAWNSGADEAPNLGHRPRHKEGYFPVPPVDSLQDIRSEMLLTLQDCGIEMECQHHEVATAGQGELDVRYDELCKSADAVMWIKYVVKNVARRHGKTATFMPKPLFGDNGTGMHTHMSIWNNGENLFAGDGYAGLSQVGLWAIGGVLKHAAALLALTNPTTNSYKRLVPGYEAPVNLAYSSRNRSAAVRIPMYLSHPKAKRMEFRCPDPTANPYLAFAALLMAGIDGIQNQIDPGPPLDKNIYDLPAEELSKVATTPGSLEDAVTALERDHEFLLRGDVFSEELVQTWIQYKRDNEIEPLRLRPHPHEFSLYFDA